MTWQIIAADVLAGLATLPDASVQTVITSPPYWGLRDYGTATWEGGDAACDHLRQSVVSRASSGLDGATATQGGSVAWGATCGKCNAVRIDSQLGLEPTPEAYVEKLVAVFREVRRVLRPDGTAWLNLGDSYAASGATGHGGWDGNNKNPDGSPRQNRQAGDRWHPNGTAVSGLKPKDLVGIPWRVAFALQADGWYLRSDVIWSKPNPMPESVTDRPTKAHEYMFLLTRSARYFYDADAVRETQATYERKGGSAPYTANGFTTNGIGSDSLHQMSEAGRNLRSVWSIATEPYPEAHFATFPKALVVPCVKAGSRIGDTILDPFCGSGTVGLVALRHGRSFVGIELNPTYAEMARERIRNDAPLWNHAAEVTA